MKARFTRRRRKTARWWFAQMRALVNLAQEWHPVPEVKKEKGAK